MAPSSDERRRDAGAPQALGRRRLISGAAAFAAGLAAPMVLTPSASAASYRNEPSGATVTLGCVVPKSGIFADQGREELRAFELAIDHLNGGGDGGMLATFAPTALTGTGVNGKRVRLVSGDGSSRPDIAVAVASRMIERGASMISATADAVQALCQDEGVLFMAALSHGNETTGRDRRANGFRHFLNVEMTARALGDALPRTLGTDRRAYHLTVEHDWGRGLERGIRRLTEAQGWRTLGRAPVGGLGPDLSEVLAEVRRVGADVLVLTLYGRDLVDALVQVVRSGLRDDLVDGREVVIVVPLLSHLMAEAAGQAIEGVLGTMNWAPGLADAGSRAFVASFERRYGVLPGQAGHTCYCQTLLWADACQRAGTFRPSAVGRALEGHTFDGLGNGVAEFRAADHQCIKGVPIVRGRAPARGGRDPLEVVDVVPGERVAYPSGLFGGALGPYNDG